MDKPRNLLPPKSEPFANLDKTLHAWFSHFGGWLSPAACLLAYSDWMIHLINSPEKQISLSQDALHKASQFFIYLWQSQHDPDCQGCIEKQINDRRFENPAWQNPPFNALSQWFLLNQDWWNNATSDIRGVEPHHENLVNFSSKQALDMIAPSNFPWTNPEVINTTVARKGENFIKGLENWMEDLRRCSNHLPPFGTENFEVGKDVAITPGKVIYKNRLIELIQYQPKTNQVYTEPLLFVPAWIMKYYILDLSPHNSMVNYLVSRGHTVFMISWKNPDESDRDLSMEDYVQLGILEAIQVIHKILPQKKIHAIGYCIGGTLLMLAAALMAKKREHFLKTITLFAAQIDFTDAGELQLFIDDSQLNYLDDIMWGKGYLDGSQMQGAFSMLRSIDMIWSRFVIDYLIGERRPMTDIIAWDQDTTRLPYRMHSEYLHKLFLKNAFIEGHFQMQDYTLSPLDINIPLFVVSTVRDHVAPWKSVYKVHYFTDSDVTFVLTSGGHNTGVVNEPGHPNRNYQIKTHVHNDKHPSAEHWQDIAPKVEGSWWPAWEQWLSEYSSGKIKPPVLGNPKAGVTVLYDAPGNYVFQK